MLVKKTLIVQSSNRPTEHQASACVRKLLEAGAGFVEQLGVSEVAYARNAALTIALAVLKDSRFDTILMIDDDMVFDPQAALRVVQQARETGAPCSACYALADDRLPFEKLPTGRFMGGLGFLAIPAALLVNIASSCEVFTTEDGKEIVEFTTSQSAKRPDGSRRWMPEDYCLTQKLGGVTLLPMAVGHLKTRIILPDRDKALALIGTL